MDWTQLEFRGLSTSLDEAKVPPGFAWVAKNVDVDKGVLQARQGYSSFAARPGAHANDVGWGIGHGKYQANEKQLLVIDGYTGGTFTLTFGAQTTAAITLTTATRQTVQDALEALSNIDIGDVIVTGGRAGVVSRFQIEFTGQYSGTDVTLLSVNTGSLTGGSSPSASVAELIKGGAKEEFVFVCQPNGSSTANLYSIQYSGGSWGSVLTVATGLAASRWYFQQFGDKIYGLNGVQGLVSKYIGSTTLLNPGQRPRAPGAGPSLSQQGNGSWEYPSYGTGCTLSAASGWSGTPTAVFDADKELLTLTTVATEAPGKRSITIDCGSSRDWRHRDIWLLRIYDADAPASKASKIAEESIRLRFTNADASPVDIDPLAYSIFLEGWHSLTQPFATQAAHFGARMREYGDNVVKVKIDFEIKGEIASGKKIFVRLLHGWNWLASGKDVSEWSIPETQSTIRQKQAVMEYAYSYFDDSSGLESDLSPVSKTALMPISTKGAYVKVVAKGSKELGGAPDKVYFYRREKGARRWKLLPNPDGSYGVANNPTGGTVVFEDHYCEGEIADFLDYGSQWFSIPDNYFRSGYCGLGAWKQCLAVVARRQLWLSYIRQPERFAPSPDDDLSLPPDADDPDRGLTQYPSDNLSEETVGVHGQDSLYVVTLEGVYAKVGDTPTEGTFLRRMPGSRGAVGLRAHCPLQGGILVASHDGLWYCAAGRGFNGEDNGALIVREETKDIRETWRRFLLNTASNVTVCEFNDEVWVFNGSDFLKNTRNRNWVTGEYQGIGIHAVFPHRRHGLIACTSAGTLVKLAPGSGAAPALADDASSIGWTWETGWIDGQRQQVKRILMQYEGSPVTRIIVYDGKNGNSMRTIIPGANGPVNLPVMTSKPGTRFKLRFSGGENDKIDSVFLGYEKAGSAGSNT